jgi:hypothetical protein
LRRIGGEWSEDNFLLLSSSLAEVDETLPCIPIRVHVTPSHAAGVVSYCVERYVLSIVLTMNKHAVPSTRPVYGSAYACIVAATTHCTTIYTQQR